MNPAAPLQHELSASGAAHPFPQCLVVAACNLGLSASLVISASLIVAACCLADDRAARPGIQAGWRHPGQLEQFLQRSGRARRVRASPRCAPTSEATPATQAHRVALFHTRRWRRGWAHRARPARITTCSLRRLVPLSSMLEQTRWSVVLLRQSSRQWHTISLAGDLRLPPRPSSVP